MALGIFGSRKKSHQNGMVGVFFTDRTISLAYTVQDQEGRPSLKNLLQIPVEAGVSRSELLDSAVTRLGLTGVSTTLVLTPGHYNVMHVERPQVPDAELNHAVKWKIRDYLAYPAEEAVVETFTIPDLDAQARAANWVYAVIAHNALIQEYVDLIQDSGLSLAAIDIPEFALRNVVALEQDAVQSTGVLMINHDESLFVLVRGDLVFLTRGFEIGYEDILAPLQDTQPGGLSLEGLHPAHENTILQIQRSLDYFDGHFAQAQVSRLQLLPAEPALEGVVEMLRTNTGLKVDMFDLSDYLDIDAEIDHQQLGSSLFAIGASLRDEEAVH